MAFRLRILQAMGLLICPLITLAQTPSPTPAAQLNWYSVIDTGTSDISSPRLCDYPYRFEVRSDGSYIAGPCVLGDDTTIVQGQISGSELSELSKRISALNQNDFREAPTCDRERFLNGFSLDLVTDLSPGSVNLSRTNAIQYHLADGYGYFCYRGGKDAVNNLLTYLGQLSKEYYPTRDSGG